MSKITQDTLSGQSGEKAIVGHIDREMKRRGLESPVPMSAEERHEANLEQREINKERDIERKEAENWNE